MGVGGQPGQDPTVARDLAAPAGRGETDHGEEGAALVPDDAVVPAHFDDAEQAARAIAPRRNVWIWVNVGLVAVVCLLAAVAGPKTAALALAAQSTLAGVVRLVVREPVAGLEVRSRWLDVTFYLGAAFALVVLALTAPLD